jgi:peptidoglycan/xylan/chitin deacetylase (PgdA/CDA1 family)
VIDPAFLLRAIVSVTSVLGGRGVIINNHTQDGESMRKQLEVLHRSFEFVSLDDIPRHRSAPLRKPFCVITFDDGKKINVDAADALYRAGVPAAFYVCTDFIGGRKPLWFDELELVARAAPNAIQELGLAEPKCLAMDVLQARLTAAKNRYSLAADVSDPRIGAMDWDDVKVLSDKGFVIGAHGRRHAILTNERVETAREEIEDSIDTVTRMIGKPCDTFAFPNGNFSESLVAVARSAGARTVLTTEPTWVTRPRCASGLLPRIQLHEKQSGGVMLAKLLAARPGFLLADPNGTGRQYRLRRT